MGKKPKHKCHIDHSNERWWVLRNGKQTCCCCGSVMRKKPMTRKDMNEIAENIADVYPGRRIIVLMPGDKVPNELKPKKRRRRKCPDCKGEGTKADATWPQVGGRCWECPSCKGEGLIAQPSSNP